MFFDTQWLSPDKLSLQAHCLLHLSSSHLAVYSTGAHSRRQRHTETNFLSFSVLMQPESQHHREPDPEDESEALQEPQVSLLVGLCSRLVLWVGGGLARLAVADLGEDVHRGHVEESPGGEEHSHTCRAELALRRTARLKDTNTSDQITQNTKQGRGGEGSAFLPRVIWSKWRWRLWVLQLKRPVNVPGCTSFRGPRASERRPGRKLQAPTR